jgi:uncharacterized protein (DUF1800 family)
MSKLNMSPEQAAVIAAHRFGLGEAQLATVGDDAQGWLLAQVGAAEPQRGEGLVSAREGVVVYADFLQQRRQILMANANPSDADNRNADQKAGERFRQVAQDDVRARLVTASTSTRPFNERLALFWANHFAVSAAKANTRGLVGAFEREAIRPHLGGSFEDMLVAAVTHPAMLRYLDNEQSAGPNSRLAQQLRRRPRTEAEPPRQTGLNENLAREVLELHTLGVSNGGQAYGGWGGYTQADVTAFAAVLTGWRVPVAAIVAGSLPAAEAPGRFDAAWHEPGTKTVLGKRYGEGAQALREALHDLAEHPNTARFIAYKLARHFVADEPPPALVARLAASYRKNHGDLPTLHRELVMAPEAWATAAVKLKSPEEFVISTARVLKLGEQTFARQVDGGIGALGQRVQAPPSPAGWPDQAQEWLGPDAVWKRVEWATRMAERFGRQTDARALARSSLGVALSDHSTQQIERAADGPQALALLLLSPEFQRR